MIDLGVGPRPSSQAAVGLSIDEMHFLQEHLKLDQLPATIVTFGGNDTVDKRAAAWRAARESLAARDLLVDDLVHDDLAEQLRIVTRPHWVLTVQLYVGESLSRLCLAKGDDRFVRVLLGPDSYLIGEVDEADLAGAVTAALPIATALDFTGLNATVDQIADIFGRLGDPVATARDFVAIGADPAAAGIVGAALANSVARAEIVGIIHGDAKHEIAPHHVAVFDTVDGRILITSSFAQDGTKWLSLSGGTPARVRRAVTELIATLPDREAFRY